MIILEITLDIILSSRDHFGNSFSHLFLSQVSLSVAISQELSYKIILQWTTRQFDLEIIISWLHD